MSITTEELEKLLEEATPGPWTAEHGLPYRRMPRVHGDNSLICECGSTGTEQDVWDANARLIALAPDLAKRVIAAEKLVEALRERAGRLTEALTASVTISDIVAEAADIDMDETFFRATIQPGGKEVARRSWADVQASCRAALSEREAGNG